MTKAGAQLPGEFRIGHNELRRSSSAIRSAGLVQHEVSACCADQRTETMTAGVQVLNLVVQHVYCLESMEEVVSQTIDDHHQAQKFVV